MEDGVGHHRRASPLRPAKAKKGVPVPLKLWMAAAKIDPDALNGEDKDCQDDVMGSYGRHDRCSWASTFHVA
ncbi:hypothetical protein [Ralstonia phage phiRSL1]|uniref:Uncharacterized protein n=1 Tax=Ralstonia phage phiRSL1 TaxID=1980924 RepID=B2ZYG7_9CAUD|nr:portal protein [Ralstonia phage phiRSL1]BAG41766.1 hypothetical protein [Ralstonia phage phiRSL1]